MKTPLFWTSQKHVLSRVLQPLSWLYYAISSLHFRMIKPQTADIPIICVGNVTAGGSGKTPVSIAIAEYLKENNNIDVHFLTRGYGGNISEVKADLEEHSAHQIGDEPMLLAKIAPTWIYPNRIEGANKAAENGADIIIMDDGLQNPSIKKDMTFLVVDGKYGIGNGRILPAGPLREHFSSGLEKSDAVVIIGKDSNNRITSLCPADMPILRTKVKPNKHDVEKLTGKNVVAFAGIAHPNKFFGTLKEIGCNVISKYEFKDHYPYAQTDIQPILDEAFRLNAIPVTTAKDYVKLTEDQKQQINVLNISIVWQDEDKFASLMQQISDMVKSK